MKNSQDDIILKAEASLDSESRFSKWVRSVFLVKPDHYTYILTCQSDYMRRLMENDGDYSETKKKLAKYVLESYNRLFSKKIKLVEATLFDDAELILSEVTEWSWSTADYEKVSGVYKISIVIKDETERLIYIGSSFNLRQRLLSHEHIKSLNALGLNVKVSWIRCHQYRRIEKYLIKLFEPPLNQTFCVRNNKYSLIEDIKNSL